MIFATLLAVTLVAAQMLASGAGLAPDAGSLAGLGLSVESFSSSGWRVFSCLFLHRDGTHLLLVVAGLLLFGAPLGWKRGWLVVAAAFLAGGAVGALASLPGTMSSGGWWYVGADGGVFALMAASLLVSPRLSDSDGWVPWNLLLGYAYLALFLGLQQGQFAVGGHAPASTWTGALPGMMLAIVLSPLEHRNDQRFAAIFLFLALFFYLRLLGHAGSLVRGDEPWQSVGVWVRGCIDLFFVLLGSLYTMIQAEVVRDTDRFAAQARLDALVSERR